VVYLAAGSGMLHALDSNTGAELWAYQPANNLAAVGQSIQPGWNFSTLLDATPTLERLPSGQRLLVGGMGVGGRGYYALDVSSPRPADVASAAAQFKWSFPSASDTANSALMGFTLGKPVIARTQAEGSVVLVTSGYNDNQAIGDGLGRLWVLNATTGAVIKTFQTTAGTLANEAGLAQIAAFKERDGNSQYVYAGDLLGNVWRFDLTRAGAGPHNAELVAVLKDSSGNRQPVTTTPELVQVGSKRVILVGTGRLLHNSDMASTDTQSFYALADGASLSNARSSLVARSYDRTTDTMSGAAMDWGTERGWYFDLQAGEQINADPLLNLGTITFVSNKTSLADCGQSSYMYQLAVGTGDRPLVDDIISGVVSNNSIAARVVQLRATDGRLMTSVRRGDGSIYQHRQTQGAAIPCSKDAWREIRR
jgi:type IV pilus assembly protein PilY1